MSHIIRQNNKDTKKYVSSKLFYFIVGVPLMSVEIVWRRMIILMMMMVCLLIMLHVSD